MVQVIPRKEQNKPSTAQKFNEAFGSGMNAIGEYRQQQQMHEAMTRENEAIKRETGIDLSGVMDPKIRQQAVQLAGQAANKRSEIDYKNDQRRKLLGDIRGGFNQSDSFSQKVMANEPSMQDEIDPRETPEFYRNVAEQYAALNEHDLAMVNERKAASLERQKRDETNQKNKKETVLRAETLPLRTKIAEKGDAALQGIQNKENLLDLVRKGDLNDPTVAAILDNLPFNLGKRMMSDDTVTYKAGIIDEFRDLKNIFPGQVRVKEIEIMENKLADIYLTDAQKEAVLSSRINALKADVIRAEAAAELEADGKFYGIGQFQKEVDRRAEPKLKALYNQIYNEQKSIIQDAENRKKLPLNPKDPDDLKIMVQIKQEAGGDKEKAKVLAKKKGYTW